MTEDDLDRLLHSTTPAAMAADDLAAIANRIISHAVQHPQAQLAANRPFLKGLRDHAAGWGAGIVACAASIMIGFIAGQGQLMLGPDAEAETSLSLLDGLMTITTGGNDDDWTGDMT